MEAPLNKKAQTTIDRFMPTWADVGAFLLTLDGVSGMTKRDVQPTFDKPETVQPRTMAEIRQINKNAGIPLRTTLREEGKTDAEIDAILKDVDDEAAKAQERFEASLVNAERRFGQGDASANTNADKSTSAGKGPADGNADQ